MNYEQLPLICEVCHNRIANSMSSFWTKDVVKERAYGRMAVSCLCCESLANYFVVNSLKWLLVLPPTQLDRGGREDNSLASLGEGCNP